MNILIVCVKPTETLDFLSGWQPKNIIKNLNNELETHMYQLGSLRIQIKIQSMKYYTTKQTWG